MTKKRAAPVITSAHAAAFRLARHHLDNRVRKDPASEGTRKDPASEGQRECPARTTEVEVCRDIGGIQAQVMSAAELQIWTRHHAATRASIPHALWERRTLVKTTCMRLTLHLLAADEFPLYVTALKSSTMAAMYGHLARVGAGPRHVAKMIAAVMEALEDGPKAQQELIACARKVADRAMRRWLKYPWMALRPAILEGLMCYGPPRGNEVTFVRVDQWLPRLRAIDEGDARRGLVRRFLTAYGPATLKDFMKWSGMRAPDARSAWASLADEVAPVSVDGSSQWLLRRDVSALAKAAPGAGELRLLPSFDPFLLAHASKDHLIEKRHYKRVYRNAGWISPVVLIDGRVAGVWFHETRGKTVAVDVQPFMPLDRAGREALDAELSALGQFLGTPFDVNVRCV